MVAAHVAFRPQRAGTGKRRRKRALLAASADGGPPQIVPKFVAAAPRTFDTGVAWRQLLHQARFDTVAVVRSIPFLVLIGFGILNFLSSAGVYDSEFGTKIYPVTARMLDAMRGSYQFLLVLIVAYYAGEVMWKERDAKLAEVSDAMPVPNWVPLLAKTTAMFAVVLAFMLAGVVASIAFQLGHGYTNIEPGVYLETVLIDSVPFVLMAVLAVFLQVVSNQKFLGYLLLIVGLLLSIVFQAMRFEHNLYLYPSAPDVPYSDMNGFGHVLQAWAWFRAYWTVFAAMLLILAAAFWVRGVAQSWRVRWRHALRILRGPQGAALAGLALAFAADREDAFMDRNFQIVLGESRRVDLDVDVLFVLPGRQRHRFPVGPRRRREEFVAEELIDQTIDRVNIRKTRTVSHSRQHDQAPFRVHGQQ
jgi:hypothetical protein